MDFTSLPITLAQAGPSQDGGGGGMEAALGGGADEIFSLVQALPIEAHLATAVLLLSGLALWLFGGKILKPIFGLAGVVLGGMVGMILLPGFGSETIFGQPSSVIGAVIGAVIGLVVALMMLRLAIVVAAALGLATLGFMGAAIYLSIHPLPDDAPPPAFERDTSDRSSSGKLLFEYAGQKMTLEELTKTLREANSFLGGSGLGGGGGGSGGTKTTRTENGVLVEPGGESEDRGERFRAIAVRCEAIVRESYDMAKARWNALAMRERVLVMGSTFGGLAAGLFVGFFLPKKSTAFITALLGSAVWLTAGAMLLEAYVPSVRKATDQPPAVWASIWLFVFLLGLVIQLAGLGGAVPEKKPKKDAGGDDEEEEE
jgi:hypothetical protein